MSFAEIILRIGASIGGWLIFLGLALTLSALPEADCDPGSDELWRGTIFFALLSLLGLCFVSRGNLWSGSIRWFALPAGGLAIYAAFGILPALTATSLGGAPLCGIVVPSGSAIEGLAATRVERVWPLVQIGVLGFGVAQALRCWRAPTGSDAR